MAVFSANDPVYQKTAIKSATGNITNQSRLEATALPQVAANVAAIYKQSPWVSPSVILSLAKGNASQPVIDAASSIGMKQYIANNDPQPAEKKGWFERNVFDNLKSVSRWSFAALDLVPQLAQNAASQIFSSDDPAGHDGWFASTTLGTMMAASQGKIDPKTGKPISAGDGYLFGGTAAETQAERARRFRGTINGSAWTVGRGSASLVFTPGSREYGLLSGFVDAAVNLYADPTMIAGEALRVAKTGEQAKGLLGTRKIAGSLGGKLNELGIIESNVIPALKTADELAAAQRIARGEAGLNAKESIAFKHSDYMQWITSNHKTARLTKNLADIASNVKTTIATGKLVKGEASAARAKGVLEVIKQFKGNIDIETATRFLELDTLEKQQAFLGETAARLVGQLDGIASPENVMLPRHITDLGGVGATSAARQAARERVPLYRNIRNSRWFTMVPKTTTAINGTGLEKTQAVLTYERYAKGMKLDKNDPQAFSMFMGKVVNAFSESDVTVAKDAIDTIFDDMVVTALKASGEDARLATNITKYMRDKLNEQRAFNLNDLGKPDDGGLVQSLTDTYQIASKALRNVEPQNWENAVLNGPGALVELADNVHVLPNFRKMRALTANPAVRRMVLNGGGESRKSLEIIEFIQNDVWKKLTLMQGGYIMRNMFDAQYRIATTGLKGFFNHPFQYVQYAMLDRGVGNIIGDEFDNAIANKARNWEDGLDNFQEALSSGMYRNMENEQNVLEAQFRNKDMGQVTRGVNATSHTNGYVDNLAIINADPILRRVAMLQDPVLNSTVQQRTEKIVEFLGTSEGAKARKVLEKYVRGGIRIADPVTGKRLIVKFGRNDTDQVVASWINKLSEARVNTIVRGDEDLRFIVAHGETPLMQKGVKAAEIPMRLDTVELADPKNVKQAEVGTKVLLGKDANKKDTYGIIVRIDDSKLIDPFTQLPSTAKTAIIQPVAQERAFTRDYLGSPQLRELIDFKGNAGINPVTGKTYLAEQVKVATRGIPKGDAEGKRALAAWKSGTDFFFQGLYGRASKTLEKSVVYRQLYYKEVAANADLLSPAEAKKLLTQIDTFAADAGTTAEKYVGNKSILKKIEESMQTPGDGTIKQLEQYSSAVALRDTKELLYNAVDRSNLEDILRIVIPFGPAWKEVLGTYMNLMIEDPSRIRHAQLAFTGAGKFDPDQNGQGFFYKDAVTGDYTFNFPGSGWLAKHLTGLTSPLQGNVKGLSIGLGVLPGIGPMAQVAASKIIPDTPQFDEITKILLPYGRKTNIEFMPASIRRLGEAIAGNTQNLETVYGNTYMEVIRVLSTSGEYDLTNPNEREKLYSDARSKAKILAGMRAIGQFLGPTSPSLEFEVSSKDGDIYATKLVQEFHKLQSENYDTAVQKFLETYGDDAFLYISSKTRSIEGGLEASDAFGEWERDPQNKNLFNMYPDVAGYMAPPGDNFSFQTWNRQLTTGKRERLTDREMVAQAEFRIASSKYRMLKNQLGNSPTANQREWLSQWKDQLYKQYPGYFTSAGYDPTEFPRKIKQMQDMITNPALKDNAAAIALKQYLPARDKALASVASSGYKNLSSKAAQPLRDWLSSIASMLVVQTPEFARIFEQELASEVDQ